MSPCEAEGGIASSEEKESHRVRDSANGEKCGLSGVGCARVGLTIDGEETERKFEGGEKLVPFNVNDEDRGL